MQRQIPKPEKVSTQWCKDQIAASFVGGPSLEATDPKNWKRMSKRKVNGQTVRTFLCTDGNSVEVAENATVQFTQTGKIDVSAAAVEASLKAAAANIRHNGDYGHLYYNHKKQAVIWCGADGDFAVEQGHTDWDDAEELLSVPGIATVDIEAEDNPDEEDLDWKFLGQFGFTMYAKGMVENCAIGEKGSQLTEGWMAITFRYEYTRDLLKNSLCYVRKFGNNFKVYSFYHETEIAYKADYTPVNPKAGYSEIADTRILEGVPHEWDMAIQDIYKYCKL